MSGTSSVRVRNKKTSELNLLVCPQNRVMFIFLLLQLKLAFLGLEKLIHYGGEKLAPGLQLDGELHLGIGTKK